MPRLLSICSCRELTDLICESLKKIKPDKCTERATSSTERGPTLIAGSLVRREESAFDEFEEGGSWVDKSLYFALIDTGNAHFMSGPCVWQRLGYAVNMFCDGVCVIQCLSMASFCQGGKEGGLLQR